MKRITIILLLRRSMYEQIRAVFFASGALEAEATFAAISKTGNPGPGQSRGRDGS